MLAYFCITGILCMLIAFKKLKTEKNSFEDFKNHNETGIESEQLILIICGLLGWLLIPLSIIRDIYHLITGKDILKLK